MAVTKPTHFDDARRFYHVKSVTGCAWKIQLTVGFDGCIWDAYGAVVGPVSDLTLLEESGVLNHLSANNRAVADKAYIAQRYEHLLATPIKNPPHGTVTADEKKWNKALYHARSIVENVNARMKQWAVMNAVWRGDREDGEWISMVVLLIARLTNFVFEHNPVRADVHDIAH